MIINKQLYKKIMEKIPVVCVDGLIINEKKEFLLVKRANEPLKNEYWLVGGRLHKNELIHQAMKRKLYQEIGVKNLPIKYLGHFEEFFEKTEQKISGNFHSISFVHLVFLSSKTKIKLDNQSLGYKWHSKLPKIFYKHIPWLKSQKFEIYEKSFNTGN